MIVSVEQRNKKLYVSYVDDDGGIKCTEINVPHEEYYTYDYCAPNSNKKLDGFMSWDGRPVTKIPSYTLDNHRLQEFFMDYEDKLSFLFKQNMPKLYSCDIEVEVTDDGFPDAESARNRVTAIAISHYPNVIVFGCNPLSGEEIDSVGKEINKHLKVVGSEYKFIYKYHENEADLLYDFLYNYVRKIPLLTGWNFWGYDWRYIVNRCKKLGLDISWLSPTKKWTVHTFDDRKGKSKIDMPCHKLIVDYMKIYQKWDRTIDIKENDTLDYVAEVGLGINKIKYPGTLKDLFVKDYPLYVAYNAIDTIIVELLDKRLKTMGTFLGLGNLTRVEALQAFSPINMLQSTITRYAYPEKKVFPKVRDERERESYEGAFVFEPTPGIYKNVASFDFASLYPTIMRQFNISFENFLFKDKLYTPKDDEIKCASGAVFKGDKEYLLPKLLTDFYNQRKKAKKVAFQAEEDSTFLRNIIKERKAKANSALA